MKCLENRLRGGRLWVVFLLVGLGAGILADRLLVGSAVVNPRAEAAPVPVEAAPSTPTPEPIEVDFEEEQQPAAEVSTPAQPVHREDSGEWSLPDPL